MLEIGKNFSILTPENYLLKIEALTFVGVYFTVLN